MRSAFTTKDTKNPVIGVDWFFLVSLVFLVVSS
jgi:hypothetical protein